MNIAIIYHDADFDGKLSNEVCRYHLTGLHPDANVHSYGWDYDRPLPLLIPLVRVLPHKPQVLWCDYDKIYIVDLSVDALMERPELRDKIIWIDHHKSAIERWSARGLKGYRIDGVAACRLCWQWFSFDFGPNSDLRHHPVDWYLPQIRDYIDRKVDEPTLLRLAGEYDVWDHRDPDAKALQFGLRALSDVELAGLIHYQFACGPRDVVDRLYLQPAIEQGHAIKAYCDKQNDEYSASCSHTIRFEGLNFCALNIGQRGNSDLMRGGITPDHQALFAWRHVGLGNNPIYVSLYHAPGHEDLDLSEIAKRWGGGGHRGACGFRTTLAQLDDILIGVQA